MSTKHQQNNETDGARKGFTLYTPAELQRKQLEKLLKNPDKAIDPLEDKGTKRPREPSDVMRKIGGSCAGAGSGDFHVYRATRRREYERLDRIESEQRKEREDQEYQEKLAKLRQEDEEREAKKRAQRQRKKQKRRGKSDNNNSHSNNDSIVDTTNNSNQSTINNNDDDDDGAMIIKKRIAQPNIPLPIEESGSDDDNASNNIKPLSSNQTLSVDSNLLETKDLSATTNTSTVKALKPSVLIVEEDGDL
ncbi:hypothetical protein BDF19DRAFT_447853 [Syncephalis fuscata]|nr:hypothetical protein BDF19DRAFT_447853 [Syncephalis fuscata]